MNILFIILVVLFVILLVFISFPFAIGALLSEKGHRGPTSDHFDGKQFKNEVRTSTENMRSALKYGAKRNPEKGINNYETYVRSDPLPIGSPGHVHVTFINHSSFLIQIGGLNILTDPIWSKRCSPIQWAGPARYRPPGVRFDDLPPIDIVLLSHNHYDHLDLPTLKKLNKKFEPKFITPLGVSHMLAKRKLMKTSELDWWDEIHLDQIKLTAVPANHFSARGLLDRNRTLWCGYVLEFGAYKIYYAGDSGYGQIFNRIGDHFDSMDLSLIPIGAYIPRWFMAPVHISPSEALQVHRDVNSKKSIAMHFGTFPLADDGPTTAPRELRSALAESEINEDDFIVPNEGETYSFGI